MSEVNEGKKRERRRNHGNCVFDVYYKVNKKVLIKFWMLKILRKFSERNIIVSLQKVNSNVKKVNYSRVLTICESAGSVQEMHCVDNTKPQIS